MRIFLFLSFLSVTVTYTMNQEIESDSQIIDRKEEAEAKIISDLFDIAHGRRETPSVEEIEHMVVQLPIVRVLGEHYFLMQAACGANNRGLASMLLARAADRQESWNHAFYYKKLSMVDMLMDSSRFAQDTEEGRNALFRAAESSDIDMARTVIEKIKSLGKDINTVNEHGQTALDLSLRCLYVRPRTCAEFIKAGARVTMTPYNGRTSLQHIIYCYNFAKTKTSGKELLAVLRLLLENRHSAGVANADALNAATNTNMSDIVREISIEGPLTLILPFVLIKLIVDYYQEPSL